MFSLPNFTARTHLWHAPSNACCMPRALQSRVLPIGIVECQVRGWRTPQRTPGGALLFLLFSAVPLALLRTLQTSPCLFVQVRVPVCALSHFPAARMTCSLHKCFLVCSPHVSALA